MATGVRLADDATFGMDALLLGVTVVGALLDGLLKAAKKFAVLDEEDKIRLDATGVVPSVANDDLETSCFVTLSFFLGFTISASSSSSDTIQFPSSSSSPSSSS